MSMDPPNGNDLVLDLSLEQLNLISHEAMILMALLGRNDQRINDQGIVPLTACQNGTGL